MQKTILITGASSGFGLACAEKFAREGHRLILVARREERLKALAEKLSPNSLVHIAAFDVRDAEAMQQAFDALPSEFQAIHTLINSAGLALGLEPAHKASMSDWEQMISTNILALTRMTRLCLPGMIERNAGHIFNIGSIAGSWPYPGGNVYGASKAFVQQFSRELLADCLGTNVRVSQIDPGLAETEFSNVRFKGDDAKADKVYENLQPLTAEDIADIIHWVSSVPEHVNINALEVMPTCQAWGALAVHREG